MKNLKLFVVLIGLISSTFSFSQSKEKPWSIGLYGVKTEYLGDLNIYTNEYTTSHVFNKYQGTTYNFDILHVGGAFSFDRFLNDYFDAGIYGSYSTLGFEDYVSKDDPTRSFDVGALANANLHVRIKPLGNTESFVIPFVSIAGGALAYFDVTGVDYTGASVSKSTSPIFAASATLGLGVDFKITDNFCIRYQSDLSWTSEDNIDFYSRNASKDYQFQHNLGVIYSFTFKRDRDKDGVYDKFDNCLKTPKGVKVDSVGCALDDDKDGVPNYIDKCPDTPLKATVDSIGCVIDTDNDGVGDYIDECPDTPTEATVDAKGCPVDSDKDGVADYIDECPDTPTEATVDAKGCPIDTDKDSVADYMDKCPDVPGLVENKGCPAVEEKTKEVLAEALQGIQFETGKDVIRKRSYKILDKVVAVMTENPSYNLQINGHTDNSKGVDNLELSQDRADAVKNYLVKNGIEENRLMPIGLGDTVPIASNRNSSGRAQNRRVEFKIVF